MPLNPITLPAIPKLPSSHELSFDLDLLRLWLLP